MKLCSQMFVGYSYHCTFPLLHTSLDVFTQNVCTHTFSHSSALRPSDILGPLFTDAHTSQSTTFCRHLLTFIHRRSFSPSSIHLNLDPSILLLASRLLSNIFSTTIPRSILTRYLIHTKLNLRRLMSYIYMEHPFLMFLDHT